MCTPFLNLAPPKWVCFVEDYKKADMVVTLGKTPVRVRRNESGGFVHHDIWNDMLVLYSFGMLLPHMTMGTHCSGSALWVILPRNRTQHRVHGLLRCDVLYKSLMTKVQIFESDPFKSADFTSKCSVSWSSNILQKWPSEMWRAQKIS